jgi:hypothetical protein
VAHQGKVLYDRRQNSTGTELANQGAA